MPEPSETTKKQGYRFPKGKSGNPGGRPKEDPEVKILAQKRTKEAIERLTYWMQSDDARASVAAANALLDRGCGKPSQSVDMKVDGSLTIELVQFVPKKKA